MAQANIPPQVSAAVGSFFRWALAAAAGAVGYAQVDDGKLDTAAAVIAGLVVAGLSILWSWWSDKKRLKADGKAVGGGPVSSRYTPLIVFCLALGAALVVGGCASNPADAGGTTALRVRDTAGTARLEQTGSPKATVNVVYPDGEQQAATSDVPVGWVSLGGSGIGKVLTAPSSSLSITDAGIGVDVTQDLRATEVDWARPIVVTVTGEDGQPKAVLTEQRFKAASLEVSGSAVVDAQSRFVEANLPTAIKLYESNQATYAAYIDSVKSVNEAWANALDSAVKAAVTVLVPVP